MQPISLIIYNIFIRLYGLAIYIASPFNRKAKLWIEGRKSWPVIPHPQKSAAEKGVKRIWLHCASLGEFEQARPVIEKIKENHPQHQIILSFFSPSGYKIRKNYELAEAVVYLPLDTKANAQKFIAEMKPDLALFVKYEFWYHYLNELKSQNIPSILFSSVFREEQIFFKWYGDFFCDMLGMFSKILVQNSESKKLLNSIGLEAEIAFDTRIDRVYQVTQSRKTFPLIEKFKGNSKIFIAGSTWSSDEKLLTLLINDDNFKEYKYIIAPHDIITERLQKLKKDIRFTSLYFSELTEANAGSCRAIIVDSIGQLMSLYAYGNVAYVGGGFNAGVHNVLEPAVYCLPVLFGPNYQKAIEAKKLAAGPAAFPINTYKDLLSALRVITERNRQPVDDVAALPRKYVTDRLGGTDKVYASISKWL